MRREASVQTRVRSLIAEAGGLPEGSPKVAILEEAARIADLHGDVSLGYEAREELVSACVFGGFGDKALAAFSWCLGQRDRDPERYDHRDLLWKYKWIINELIDHPEIALSKIEAAVDDMADRYRKGGFSLRPVHDARESLASHRGDEIEASRHHKLWAESKRDGLANCLTCERAGEVGRLIFEKRVEEAIERAAPLLEVRMRCKRQPACTFAAVLMPLFDLGRIDEAMRYHHKGYRLIERERDYLEQVAMHLQFLVLTDNLAKGIKLVEKHLGWCFGGSINYRQRFVFSKAAWFLFRRLAERGRATVKLRLARDFPAFQESHVYIKKQLADWFEADARAGAARFDARNGTDAFARVLENQRSLDARIVPFPLRPGPKTGDSIEDE